MAFASTNLLRVAYVAQTSPLVVPTSPAFQIMRVTSVSGGVEKQTARSEEFTGDRHARPNLLLGMKASVTHNFELSYSTFDALFANALRSSWSSDVLVDGATPSWMMFEEADLSGTNAFIRYLGQSVSELSLSMKPKAKITGSAVFHTQGHDYGTTAIAGATYLAPTTTEVMTSGTHVGSLAIDGLTTPLIIESLDMKFVNNLSDTDRLGSLWSSEPASAPVDLTFDANVYFQSIEAYAKAMAHETGKLSFILGNTTGEKYLFEAIVRYNDVSRERADLSKNQMMKLTLSAEKDATIGGTLKITRAVA